MTIKDKVLVILEASKNNPISGEEIAERLGCTRAGVWKAVKDLKAQGYEINAVTNKGYTLVKSADSLSEGYIREGLRKNGINLHIEAMTSIDSTNNLLKRYASSGETRDMVAIAEEQTGGRGRRGRSFYSPAGSGIYLSFLLHPTVSASEASMLTTVAAVAEAKAIEEVTGLPTSIKWVNDLYMRERKVSGILTEAATSMEDATLDYCIVGIGINLYEPEGGFPEEIRHIAGSVLPAGSTRENFKNDIVTALISHFMAYYRTFPSRDYLEDYTKRCFCIGRDVTVVSADHDAIGREEGPDRIHAHVLGVDKDCHLHVRYPDGTEGYLYSGEISIKL